MKISKNELTILEMEGCTEDVAKVHDILPTDFSLLLMNYHIDVELDNPTTKGTIICIPDKEFSEKEINDMVVEFKREFNNFVGEEKSFEIPEDVVIENKLKKTAIPMDKTVTIMKPYYVVRVIADGDPVQFCRGDSTSSNAPSDSTVAKQEGTDGRTSSSN